MLEAEQFSVVLLDDNDSQLRLFVLDGAEPKLTDFELNKTALQFSLTGAEPLVLDDISGSITPIITAGAERVCTPR